MNRGYYDWWIILRTLGIWVLAILITIFLYIALVLPIIFILRDWRLIHACARLWARCLLFISGAKVKLFGQENLYRKGSMVIAVNHQSIADIPLLLATIDLPFAWLSKASVFRIPIIGRSMRAAQYIPVERSDSRDALASLYRAADAISQRDCSVIIFPEGTRGFSSNKMRPFKKGTSILALRVKRPIQPITVVGTAKILPPKQKGHRMQRIYPGQAEMFIHPPLYPDQYAEIPPEQLSQKLWDIMDAPLKQIREIDEIDEKGGIDEKGQKYEKGEKDEKDEKERNRNGSNSASPRSSEDRAVVS